jgi:hypothetical protein
LATPVIAAAYNEVVHRSLTSKQHQRVDRAAEEARQHYLNLSAQGETLRTDDFFDGRDGRWGAGEVVEAVLLAAANDPMEMKLTHMGHLLAVAAVDKELDVQTVHWLLKLAEDLTWTQYVQLALVDRIDELKPHDVDICAGGTNWRVLHAILQFRDLGPNQRELMHVDGPNVGLKLPPLCGDLSEYKLTGNGSFVSWAFGLSSISVEILRDHIALLKSP